MRKGGQGMAKILPPVDVVLVGFGWTGAIMAQELTELLISTEN